jgi:hypothetical protein
MFDSLSKFERIAAVFLCLSFVTPQADYIHLSGVLKHQGALGLFEVICQYQSTHFML